MTKFLPRILWINHRASDPENVNIIKYISGKICETYKKGHVSDVVYSQDDHKSKLYQPYKNENEGVKYLRDLQVSDSTKNIVIVGSSGDEVVSKIHSLKHVHSILVYCS